MAFEVRNIFFPFCLQRLKGGEYLVLNRRYKPLGVVSRERSDLETFPNSFRFKEVLSAGEIAAMSFNGSTDADCIRLYDDTCVPTSNDANWTAYSARLQRLAGYDIV